MNKEDTIFWDELTHLVSEQPSAHAQIEKAFELGRLYEACEMDEQLKAVAHIIKARTVKSLIKL